MFITDYKKNKDIRAIRQEDSDFMINDGMVAYPRAMIHVLPGCPSQVKTYLHWAMENGYIKTVAHVYGKELTMDALRD